MDRPGRSSIACMLLSPPPLLTLPMYHLHRHPCPACLTCWMLPVRSIQGLLSAPNVDDPLDENVAKHWKENTADAHQIAKQWTQLYASE